MSLEVIVLDLDVIASKLRAEHHILVISIGAKTGSKEEGKMVLLIHTQHSIQCCVSAVNTFIQFKAFYERHWIIEKCVKLNSAKNIWVNMKM